MRRFLKGVGLGLAFQALVVATLVIVNVYVKAQEKPVRETRQWEVATLPIVDWKYGPVRVDVIDTEGVCLYVTRLAGKSSAIAAVPKTQLPKGAGCQ